ncbi:MAG TPA: hypothetical protein DDY14_12295 [Chromatiaceae bacterium]|nr:helix-turn-helix transcriptional regulator [Paracoccaceae bacterium]HBG96061.1 hypothetical protein [Chromatiaceae bacterium]HBG99859.1 hypothetical protein [Paracoccaceae bacterium]
MPKENTVVSHIHRVTDAQDLGGCIRAHRKRLGLTQEDLALQTGISRPTIRAIEQGKETARVGLVLQICADLGLVLHLRDDGSC